MWKKTSIYIYIAILFLVPFIASSQVSHGGKPLPLTLFKSTSAGQVTEMPPFDIQEELRIDSLEQTDLRSGYRFAYKFMTNLNRSNSGVNFTLADGTRVWKLRIRSQEALSVNVLFTEYELPEGAQLFLYNTDQSQILGSFNHRNNSLLGKLPVAPIQGDDLIIEYQEPANAAFHGRLTVGEVNHAYRDFRGQEPAPDSNNFYCMDPVSCYQEEFGTIGRSVVLLAINGVIACTGTLINNTTNDGKPYLLTASHCLNNQFHIQNPDYEEIAGNIVCFFNYNSPLCNTTLRGTEEMSVASARYRAVSENNDMALLELLETPPAYYQPYYAGWNAGNEGVSPYTGIHHPGGSVKRVNIFKGKITLEDYDYIYFDKNVHWKVDRWSSGCTAGGSSGSPLFDANNHIIGALSGGKSYCSSPKDDLYYALSKTWNTRTSPEKQLKYWLNPGKDKNQLICDGLDPYASTPCIRLSNVRESGKTETIETTRLPTSGTGALFGINSLGTTEYAEAYKVREKAWVYGVYIVNPALINTNGLNVEITLYNGDNKPATLVHSEQFRPTYAYQSIPDLSFTEAEKPLNRDQESFISFPIPLEVNETFYVGYKIMSTGKTSYSAFNLPKGETTRNTAWVKYKDNWIETTNHPVMPFATSLFIDPVIEYKNASSSEPIDKEKEVRFFLSQDKRSISILLPEHVQAATFSLISAEGKMIQENSVTGIQITIPVVPGCTGVHLARLIYNNKVCTQKILF